MSTLVQELWESRSGDNQNQELKYIISGALTDGTSDDAVARTGLATTAPATRGVLIRDDRSLHVEPIVGNEGWFVGTVRYITPDNAEKETGDAADGEFSFDTSVATVHLTQSITTISKTGTMGLPAEDYGGAIGVSTDAVEGVDIEVRAFSFEVTAYLASAAMTQAYLRDLYLLSGTINTQKHTLNIDGVTVVFEAGELKFDGASGSKRRKQDDWEVHFKFKGSPNMADVCADWPAPYKPSVAVPKKGWEYFWVRYADVEGDKAIVQRPIAVYVEKVYPNGDFAKLHVGTAG